MTIINPKSIAGVTSITTASGADNLLTVHTNNTTERVRINNDGDVIVGSGITVSPDGDIFATGVCTATTFAGDGENLTNVDVVSDTSPQLGGNLETNDKNIVFGDSSGATVNRLALGAGTDFSIYHNGTNTILDNNTGNLTIETTANEVHNVQSEFQVKVKGGDEDGLKVITDGAVELYHDNSKKFQTYGSGIQFFGNIKNETDGTNQGLFLGAANDFQFYHDGNRSAVNNRTGDLRLLGAGDVRIGRADSGNQTSYDELYAAFISNGAVELYHNNTKKFETTNTGTVTTGIATATEFVPTLSQLSHRNFIINGAMQVCQRYALASMNNISGSTHTYHTDRFKGFNSNGGILGLEWQENYPEGFNYSLRIKAVNADSSIDGLTFVLSLIHI